MRYRNFLLKNGGSFVTMEKNKEECTMAKKKWGDRPDGVWLRDLPAMNQLMTTLMPNRADNEAFVSVDIDLAPLEAYLEKKNEGLDKTHRYTFSTWSALPSARHLSFVPR